MIPKHYVSDANIRFSVVKTKLKTRKNTRA